MHHLALFGYYNTDDCGETCEAWIEANFQEDDGSASSNGSSSASFSNIETPDFCEFTFAIMFVWTPGAANAELPEDVGFRFGNVSEGFTSVVVQTHYDNPDGKAGLVDSAGVRVYYTEELRPIDMGVIQLGDPVVSLEGVPLPEGKTSISFACPSSCTEQYFEVCCALCFACCVGVVGCVCALACFIFPGWFMLPAPVVYVSC